MTTSLNVLFLEDSSDDVSLVEREFLRAGLRHTLKHVQDRDGFRTALSDFLPDLILSDYTLPGYSGLEALEDAQARCPHVPFVFVSGTIGEERAIDAMKHGALDYVVKERLAELFPRVQRALKEASHRAERRAIEEELRQAQKMEAIGRLAGGVAHDFNNLLTVIGGYSEKLLSSLPEGDPHRVEVAEIRRAAEQAGALTRQLVAFGRKQVMSPVVLNLNGVLLETERLLRRLISRDIELKLDLAPDLGNIRADAMQLGQVLMNLVINARDALSGAGRIIIETRNSQPERSDLPAGGSKETESAVTLRVRDTGAGMDTATQARIFEPFFTTKGSGRGMGLGLSTVYGIIRQSGGSIAVHSRPQGGTEFAIRFPRVFEDVERKDGGEAEPRSMRGTETVLVADDSEPVRLLMEKTLEQQGYEVIGARNGEEALRISEEREGTIHLVVTDVVMPRMGGRDLADRMASRRPATRFLYTSGYSDEEVVGAGRLEPGTAFLQKPFTPGDLARKVRSTLDVPVEGTKT